MTVNSMRMGLGHWKVGLKKFELVNNIGTSPLGFSVKQ